MGIVVTGAMTMMTVAREVTGTTTTGTAMKGMTIDIDMLINELAAPGDHSQG
jgi:hypothetical protein